MTHSPAFWLAFAIAIALIMDGYQTLKYLDIGPLDLDLNNARAKVVVTCTIGLILLVFVFWTGEFLK